MKDKITIKHYWGGKEVSTEELWQLFLRFIKRLNLTLQNSYKTRRDIINRMKPADWFGLINFKTSQMKIIFDARDEFFTNYHNDNIDWYFREFKLFLGEKAYEEFISLTSYKHGDALVWMKFQFLIQPAYVIGTAFDWNNSSLYGASFWSRTNREWIEYVARHQKKSSINSSNAPF